MSERICEVFENLEIRVGVTRHSREFKLDSGEKG